MNTEQAKWADSLAQSLRSKNLIDISVIVDQHYPCFQQESQEFLMVTQNRPGSGPKGYRGPFLEKIMITDDHTGTHCDTPAHMIPPVESGLPNSGAEATITAEQLDLTKMIGPACVIDCTDLLEEVDRSIKHSPVITKEKIEAWEQDHGEIKKGDIVLFKTTWTDLYYKEFPEGLEFTRHHPAPNGETTGYLAEKGVPLIGIDALGCGMFQDDYEPHIVALKAQMIIVEKLTRLGELPPRGAFFVFLPIKVKGASGALGRAIALV